MDAHRHSALNIPQLKPHQGQRWHGPRGLAADTQPCRGRRRGGWSRGMGLLGLIGLLGLLGWGAAPPPGQNLLQPPSRSAQIPEPSRRAKRLVPYNHLPLSFEANQGQTDGQVQFLAHGQGYQLFLTAREAVFVFRLPAATHVQHPTGLMPGTGVVQATPDTPRAVMRMQLLGANPAPQVAGLEELPGKANYFIGNDPHKWRTNVPTYARVKYANVYPGVDLVYYGNQGRLEYDFVVQPGADPTRIALNVGASLVPARGRPRGAPLRVAENGDLVVGTEGSEVVFQKPVIYQPATDYGQRTRDIVEGKYIIRAGQQVTFEIASYDKTRPLVIDPTLVYSSYLGGSNEDEAAAIAVDAAGHAYVTGQTLSTDFPTTPGAFQTAKPGVENTFVSKLNAAGSALLHSSYLGGNDIDNGTGISVDAAANAYVTGYSFSSNFPTISGAFQTTFGGVVDAFVAKVAALTFAGTPGTANCQGESVSALAREFGGLEAAAAALGFPSVQALQDAIQEFCEG